MYSSSVRMACTPSTPSPADVTVPQHFEIDAEQDGYFEKASPGSLGRY